MKKYLIILGLIFLGSCSQTTSYQSIANTAMASTFSVQDQESLVNQLGSLLINDNDLKSSLNGTPVLLVDIIKNKTNEHIDTESITDTLKVSILKAKLFRIVNRNNLNILAKEQELVSAGMTDSERAAQIGKLWGAKYVLYGNFSSIVNYVNSDKTTFYKLTLVLQNIETGEEIWANEATINKVTK